MAALPEPAAEVHDQTSPANGTKAVAHRSGRSKRATISLDADAAATTPAAVATNGAKEIATAESTSSA
jgi:hypothetical protein